MEWDPHFLARSPMFETLRAHATAFGAGWPERADLQRLLDRHTPPVRTSAGMSLRLAPQGRRSRVLEDRYEARIYLRGEMACRERNWHDLLNVLVWLAFPRAKAALNARHYAALSAQHAAGAANRGPTQDTLTLFDEGGVIVASSDGELLACLREWRWKDLFWANRARLAAQVRFRLFGHALYEKALRPFIGVTGRGILLKTEPELIAAPLVEQMAALDAKIAEHVSDAGRLVATRELAVVPILGVPGWCSDNEREAYYDNTDYFRPGRREP
ncbi:MAG: DUF3025 domain-containing protein [Betaproteobacteria bacterium]|nr:DUF3025 domain-containing protein [Betaproteobacteria bacterium]